MTAFRHAVAEAVQSVPPGWVTTYGDVAAVIGHPSAARRVGYALSSFAGRADVPWHRVINRLGTISFRGDDLRGIEQRRRLEAEGVPFDIHGRVPLVERRWRWESSFL